MIYKKCYKHLQIRNSQWSVASTYWYLLRLLPPCAWPTRCFRRCSCETPRCAWSTAGSGTSCHHVFPFLDENIFVFNYLLRNSEVVCNFDWNFAKLYFYFTVFFFTDVLQLPSLLQFCQETTHRKPLGRCFFCSDLLFLSCLIFFKV